MDKGKIKIILNSLLLIITCWFVYSVWNIMLPFILGFIIAYFLNPVRVAMVNRFKIKNKTASIILIVLFILLVVFVILIMIPIFMNQLVLISKELIAQLNNNYQQIYDRLDDIFRYFGMGAEDITLYFEKYRMDISTHFAKLVNNLVSSSFDIVNTLFLVIISPIVAYYFLNDWDLMACNVWELVPPNRLDQTKSIAQKINKVVISYCSSQLNVAGILFICYTILFWIMGLKYAFFIGILGGFLIFIPYVGPLLAMCMSFMTAYLQWGWDPMKFIIIAIIFSVCIFIEGNFLTPNIVGNKIELHPAWTMFAIFAGGSLMGFMGMLIALPVGAVIGVLVREYFSYYKKSRSLGNECVRN